MSSLWHVCRWSCQIYKCETWAKYKIQNVKYINWKYDKSTECCFSHLLHTAFTNIWRWLQTKGTKYSFSHLQNIEGGYKRTTTLPFGDFHGSDTDPLTGGGKPDPRWTIYFHDNWQRSEVKNDFQDICTPTSEQIWTLEIKHQMRLIWIDKSNEFTARYLWSLL